MKQIFQFLYVPACIIFLFSCAGNKRGSVDASALLHRNYYQLTKIIIYDVFSPPVASRIYAYTSIAAYEAIRFAAPGYPSLAAQLRGFARMPQPDPGKKYNYPLAATKAYFTVAHKIVFAVDSLKEYENKIFADCKDTLDEETYNRSVAFGEMVGNAVLQRAAADNYKKSRGMPKYLGGKEDGRWQPTSPDYLDGTEPFWSMITPLVLDSASQFMPKRPPPFSKDKNSLFYKNALDVYTIRKNLTDSQITVVQYWDDNPFVMEHSGHLMFANKKITPGGHWMGIAGVACRKANAGPVQTAQTYALTAIALFDGFIACWDEKYRSQYIRPATVIHNMIDDQWDSYLQTPPFPEYPSGHSTISAAAATMLTKLFGEHFSFHDDSNKEYIGMERDFNTFYDASDEASASRVYGGIHFKTGIESGMLQGREVGKFICEKLKLKE